MFASHLGGTDVEAADGSLLRFQVVQPPAVPGGTVSITIRRPGSNGIVHSIEAYDDRRNLVLQLFGRPADAEAESEAWRALIAEVRQTYGL